MPEFGIAKDLQVIYTSAVAEEAVQMEREECT
jgi:hypothetical protein